MLLVWIVMTSPFLCKRTALRENLDRQIFTTCEIVYQRIKLGHSFLFLYQIKAYTVSRLKNNYTFFKPTAVYKITIVFCCITY